jgi:16S rRNA (uracil1498-N3)-methyltransferase
VHEPRFAADAGAAAHVLVDALTDDVSVTGDDGHHLARARRLRPGEVVTAADGTGAWRPYVVAAATRDGLDLAACGPIAIEPSLAPRVTVAFALTKGAKPELVVQKITELGADAILPVHACRSVRRSGDEARSAAATERLRRVAREATAQCRRARLPEVATPVPLDALAGRAGLVVAARDGRPPDALAEPPGGEWVLVVGPEGGLDPAELTILGDPPGLAVGPHVLRAETAAIAATAALAGRRRLA